jgi:group I intron endonuclease
MFGYIYKTTNIINNKIYIGQHVATEFDKYYKGSGTILAHAFKKYGKENFNCVLLEAAETKDELDAKEIYWIDKLDSRNKSIGYNITAGGEGTVGYQHTEEAKKKMSIAKKGKQLTDTHKKAIGLRLKGHTLSEESKAKLREANLGQKRTEETKQKLREAHKKNPRNFTEEYRRKLRESRARVLADGTWSISEEGMARLRASGSRPKSPEHCQHLSESRINSGIAAGAKNPRAKKIYCIETDTVYSWAGEAAEKLGLSVHMIRQCRQGKTDNVKGYHFVDFIEN